MSQAGNMAGVFIEQGGVGLGRVASGWVDFAVFLLMVSPVLSHLEAGHALVKPIDTRDTATKRLNNAKYGVAFEFRAMLERLGDR